MVVHMFGIETDASTSTERSCANAEGVGSSRSEHIPPLLWFPISFCFKVLTLKALNVLGPRYLTDCLLRYQPSWALWAAGEALLVAPPAVSMAAPLRWTSPFPLMLVRIHP